MRCPRRHSAALTVIKRRLLLSVGSEGGDGAASGRRGSVGNGAAALTESIRRRDLRVVSPGLILISVLIIFHLSHCFF